MDKYNIIIEPLMTEKASADMALNKYTFKVNEKSNRVEIKKSIEEIFNVKVEKVNLINCSGKKRRFGRVEGRTKNWKKAIVTLKSGEKIEKLQAMV